MSRVQINQPRPGAPAEFSILCPGCRSIHNLSAALIGRNFRFNGNLDRPTFTPEISLRVGPFGKGHKMEGQTITCHFRIRDGLIRYFHDTNHDLRLQTAGLPDFDEIAAMRQAREDARRDLAARMATVKSEPVPAVD
jgi:hypothetical protein